MSRKNRTTKDNVGIVYLFTNRLYEQENTYKYGITINPFQRKRIQNNSTPPSCPFYDIIVMFSKNYKEIEHHLTTIFMEKGMLLSGEDGGKEWIKANIDEIIDIYKDMLVQFPETEMCYHGRRYKYENGSVNEYKIPNCRLDLLGILDGDIIKCTKNNESFQVQNNGILVYGEEMSLTKYMNSSFKRDGNTNQHNGYMYFTYKGTNIYKMWQKLLKGKEST